ncbi:hypothetical protein ACWKSP_19825 [Micromonosporaceae bacterium Da 78-11]
MRRTRIVLVLAALPLTLGACGGGAAKPAASATPAAGEPWVVVATGSATPSPTPSAFGSPSPALPSVSFLPTASGCAMGRPEAELVLIPIVVTPLTGSLKVEWPARYGPTYRVTAVDQRLVSGAQPEPVWQTVSAGGACIATATITGLTSGAPYIVWLDAPESGYQLDGTSNLRSGKSRVVKPL